MNRSCKCKGQEFGTVRFFDPARGFGFIESEHGGSAIFMHYSGLLMGGFRTIAAETPVEFSVAPTGDGRWKAVNVRPLN